MTVACQATRTYAEQIGPDNICGEPVVGFALYVDNRHVSGILDGSRPDPELHLQPRCAKHMQHSADSNRRLIEVGPSQALVDAGFIGAAVGTVWIVQPPADGEV